MKLFKRIAQGEVIPPYYGIYNYSIIRDCAFAIIVPFHIPLGLALYLYNQIRWGWKAILFDRHRAYDQGFKDGKAAVRGNQ